MKQKYIFLISFLLLSPYAFCQPLAFQSRGTGGGQSFFTPSINPSNYSEFYIAGSGGAMFHTTTAGSLYTQLPFTSLSAMSVSTYEFTSNPTVAYSINYDNVNGTPVKTIDGGFTWLPLPGYSPALGEVYVLKANYNRPNQVVVNYCSAIMISNDGGATFDTVALAISAISGITLGGVYFDSNRVFVGTNQGIYESLDSGITFHPMLITGMDTSEAIWQFRGGKKSGHVRFSCIAAHKASVHCGLTLEDYTGLATNIYTMDNESGTWAPRSGTINFTTDNVMYMDMASNCMDTFYLAGHDGSTNGPLVYKTTDGGMSWAKVFKTLNNMNIFTGWGGFMGDKDWTYAKAVYGIAVAPNNANTVVVSDKAFVHATTNGGLLWTEAYAQQSDDHPLGSPTPTGRNYHSVGLENTSCWDIQWIDGSNLMAALSNLTAIRSNDSGNSWDYRYLNLPQSSIYKVLRHGNNVYAAGSSVDDVYQPASLTDAVLDITDLDGKIMFSADTGFSWAILHKFNSPVYWIAADPNDTDKMYASVVNNSGDNGGIWMTSDLHHLSTSTWTRLSAPPRTEGHPVAITVLNDGKVLCSFTARIDGTGAYTASSGVFLYDPSTSTWSDVSDANMYYQTNDVIVDPRDLSQNTWYACVSTPPAPLAAGQGGVYKTTDRGATWTKLTGALIDKAISITVNPLNFNQAFVTTAGAGLMVCNNLDSPSTSWTTVSSYAFGHPQRVFFNPHDATRMWVSSAGNGMKMAFVADTAIDTSHITTNVTTLKTGENLKIYPSPAQNTLIVENAQIGSMLEVFNIDGRQVFKGYINDHKQALNIAGLTPGIYVMEVTTGNLRQRKQFVKE